MSGVDDPIFLASNAPSQKWRSSAVYPNLSTMRIRALSVGRLMLLVFSSQLVAAWAAASPDESRGRQPAWATRLPTETPVIAALQEPRPDAPGITPPVESASALAPFFDALARTKRGEGITRVTHMGDSSIGRDNLPHILRTFFQEEYGDAGPGFVLLQPHSTSYLNRTVFLNTQRWDEICFIIRQCKRDGHYGLGGVSVESGRGASTLIRPKEGRVVSRAEIWYAAQPRAGTLRYRFGEGRPKLVDIRAPELEDRWLVEEREPGEHALRIDVVDGTVRAYGAVLENDGPGLVWDTLSMIGAFTHRLLAQDEAHFANQLRRRDSDLIVLSYGGNDLRRIVDGNVDEAGLREETRQLLARVRTARPEAGCLLLGINDHLLSGVAHIKPEHTKTVIDAQRAAAHDTGCAFWDTLAAMGGPGTFRPWLKLGLARDDGKHITPRGRVVLGKRLHSAILHARDRYGLEDRTVPDESPDRSSQL